MISLSSGYGTGKTYFIKNWVNDLNGQGYKAIYFNAWEEDYAEDAFVSFMSSVQQQLDVPDGELQEKWLDTVKKGGDI